MPARGRGSTTTPRPATGRRWVLPASAKPLRPPRRRLSGGGGIPTSPSRQARSRDSKPSGAGQVVGPGIPRNIPTPASARPRRRRRRCRRHRRRRHLRHRPHQTGSRRCRRHPRRRPGIALPIRWIPRLRRPAASRSRSCWRACKPARPGVAGAGAARTEAKTTGQLRRCRGTVLTTVRYPHRGTGTNQEIL